MELRDLTQPLVAWFTGVIVCGGLTMLGLMWAEDEDLFGNNRHIARQVVIASAALCMGGLLVVLALILRYAQ